MIKEYKKRLIKLLPMQEVLSDLLDGYIENQNVSCPFSDTRHEHGTDISKSMSIDPVTGACKCFACGYTASSIVGLASDIFKLDYVQTCRKLINDYIEPLVSEARVEHLHQQLLSEPFVLNKLKELRGFTDKTISKFQLGLCKSKIVIPIRNQFNMVCNLRLYDVLSQSSVKILSFKKGYGKAKLFPYSAFNRPDTIYLFEGETDTMLAWQLGLNAVTTTVGANTWKKSFNKFFKNRDVVIVPDTDTAGQQGLKLRLESLKDICSSLGFINIPKDTGKDFTEYIIDNKHTIQDFKKLPVISATEKSKTTLKIKPKEIKNNITLPGDVKIQEGFKAVPVDIAHLANAELVFGSLQNTGNFFKDQGGKLHFVKSQGSINQNAVIPVKSTSPSLLSELSKINPLVNTATTTGRFIVQHVITKANILAKEVITAPYTTYKDNKIFISSSENNIVQITKQDIQVVKNVFNSNNILLSCPDNASPIIHKKQISIERSIVLLQDLLWNNIALSPEDKYFLLCWTFSSFFMPVVRVRPIIRLSASTASGKSTASKLISTFLYGNNLLQHASTMAAIYAMASMYPVLIFDNIESRNMTPDYEDFLLIASTGGFRSKRTLLTDTGITLENTDCMVLTNGIEPFTRPEVLSRIVDLQMDKTKYGRINFNEIQATHILEQKRNYMIPSILKVLCNKVSIRVNNGDIHTISNKLGKHNKDRFNDYYGLCSIILDALWPYMPLSGYTMPKTLVDTWIGTQGYTDTNQAQNTNDILYFIDTLVAKHKTILDLECAITDTDGIIKIKGQTRSLLSDFRLLAKQLGMRCPWDSAQQLGVRITDSIKVLKRAGWEVKKVSISGRLQCVFVKEK